MKETKGVVRWNPITQSYYINDTDIDNLFKEHKDEEINVIIYSIKEKKNKKTGWETKYKGEKYNGILK